MACRKKSARFFAVRSMNECGKRNADADASGLTTCRTTGYEFLFGLDHVFIPLSIYSIGG